MNISKHRETMETKVDISLETEGCGRTEIDTGVLPLNEILSYIAAGSRFDLNIKAKGDLATGDHHTTEDVGITLGLSLRCIARTGAGSAIVPSGECLALVAVRFGRPSYRGNFEFQSSSMNGMDLENFCHFFRAIAFNGNISLHIRADGGDDLNRMDAISTAFGKALREAIKNETELQSIPVNDR